MKIQKTITWAASLILAAGIATAFAGSASGAADLSKRHRAWLEDDAALIITPAEREAFLGLGSGEERDRFIEELWLQRDPTPGTPANEFRTEHFRRLAFADGAFGPKRGTEGRTTPRGRMYIRLGSPLDVARIEAEDLRPLEIWTYVHGPVAGRTGLFRILFYRPAGSREYALYDPAVDKPSRLAPGASKAGREALEQAAAAPAPFEGDPQWGPADQAAFRMIAAAAGPDAAECLLTCLPGERGTDAARRSSDFLAGRDGASARVDDGWASRWRQGRALPAVATSIRTVPAKGAMRAYFEPDGSCVLHVAAAPERVAFESTGDLATAWLRTTITLTDEAGRTIFERARDSSLAMARPEMRAMAGKALRLYDALPLRRGAGPMTARWRLENLADKTSAVVEGVIEPPAGGAPGLTEPILGRRGVQTAAAAGAARRAFQIGSVQIDPEPEGVFGKDEEIWLFVQVSGLAREQAAAARIEVRLRAAGGGEPPVARATLAEAADGNVLMRLPAEGRAGGDGRIEVRLVGGDGRTILSREAPVSLRDGEAPGTWIVAGVNPPAGDPYHAYIMGLQLEKKNAGGLLAEAWRAREESVEFAVGYAEALLAAGDVGPARDVLRRYIGQPGADYAFYRALARAAAGAGQTREAAEAWEKALGLRRNDPGALDGLGDCRLALGDKAAARAAWERALDIQPDLADVKKKLESLR